MFEYICTKCGKSMMGDGSEPIQCECGGKAYKSMWVVYAVQPKGAPCIV